MDQPKYKEHVSEPWFTLISLGLKKIEGRKNKGRFKEMAPGDIVEWYNDDFGFRSVKTKIIKKNVYPTFKKYLESEGIDKCLPSIKNLDQAVNIYYKYSTKEEESEYGVVAIHIDIV